MTKVNKKGLMQLQNIDRKGTIAGDEMDITFTLERSEKPLVPDRIMFMDLDGTIIETKSGKTFPIDTNDWKFKEGILEKIRQFVEQGFQLCIVSNQAGIEKGFVKPLAFREKLDEIIMNITVYLKEDYKQYHSFLGFSDEKLVTSFIADSMDSKFRKPNHKWVYEAFPTLDYDKSFMVGDASGIERKKPVQHDYHIDTLNEISSEENSNLIELNGSNGRESYFCQKGSWFQLVKDFSDSDAKFAANLGIQYFDVEEFLKDSYLLTEKELSVINNFIDDAPFPTPPNKQNK